RKIAKVRNLFSSRAKLVKTSSKYEVVNSEETNETIEVLFLPRSDSPIALQPLTDSPVGLRLCHWLTSQQKQLLKPYIVVGYPDSEFISGSPQTEVHSLRVMCFIL
ncbi:hypothetical protein AVEN_33069-1, partial [Araneus ventricosus]